MIELQNISKNYQYVKLFNRVNFTFNDGMAYGLVGRNGSGKSVLLRMIVGFAKPDTGRIVVDGKVLGQDFDFLQDAGVSINQPEFMAGWTGYDNLMYLAEIQNKIAKEEVLAWVNRLGLKDAIKRKYKTYSQGMKQKMRIIQALMENPKYLILDEPFVALDQKSVFTVQKIFQHFKAKDKMIIFTSHDDKDIKAIADVILPIESLTATGQREADRYRIRRNNVYKRSRTR